MPRYPHIQVCLPSPDGNILAFLGRVMSALSRAGVAPREVDGYISAALAGDYQHLLRVTSEIVAIDLGDDDESEAS